MRTRDIQPEWMDQPGLSSERHAAALSGLVRLNSFTGVSAAMYRQLRKLAVNRNGRAMKVLDIASGAGDVPIAWAKKARRDGLALQVTTIDISHFAAEEQQRRASAAGVTIRSLTADCLTAPLPQGFDLVTCSLFMHHLNHSEVVRLLQSMQVAANDGILICDLDRSRANLGLVTIGAHMLSRSRIVHHDAKVSVRSAFTAEEFKAIAEKSLSRPVSVWRSFPCRFIATLDTSTVVESSVAFA
ncbi:hypothetical protein Poly51_56150 [Rubripirellula tenax]|uniref:Methyltransferase domain-containing protein n=1 Tax=Rubripirellula tenax TaxID=2528015 RepID=A0A5C6EG44_9BACT|nr:methyltransferase domain-containing protein [Rubripirellula tenax]TWU46219.1 hypothetical protein Poly51_56150 [Rubripirellula tenax]